MCVQVQLSLGDFVAARRSLKKAFTLGSQQPVDREAVKRAFKHGETEHLGEGGARDGEVQNLEKTPPNKTFSGVVA